MVIEKEVLAQLAESGVVHSLVLLRSDIKNYRALAAELEMLQKDYTNQVISLKEKVMKADEDLKKVKSSGYGSTTGSAVADEKLNKLISNKQIAENKLQVFFEQNNFTYYNRVWVLSARIANVECLLSKMNYKDRKFIEDLYIKPIGFKNVADKYRIENEGNIYRKANNILRKYM